MNRGVFATITNFTFTTAAGASNNDNSDAINVMNCVPSGSVKSLQADFLRNEWKPAADCIKEVILKHVIYVRKWLLLIFSAVVFYIEHFTVLYYLTSQVS